MCARPVGSRRWRRARTTGCATSTRRRNRRRRRRARAGRGEAGDEQVDRQHQIHVTEQRQQQRRDQEPRRSGSLRGIEQQEAERRRLGHELQRLEGARDRDPIEPGEDREASRQRADMRGAGYSHTPSASGRGGPVRNREIQLESDTIRRLGTAGPPCRLGSPFRHRIAGSRTLQRPRGSRRPRTLTLLRCSDRAPARLRKRSRDARGSTGRPPRIAAVSTRRARSRVAPQGYRSGGGSTAAADRR